MPEIRYQTESALGMITSHTARVPDNLFSRPCTLTTNTAQLLIETTQALQVVNRLPFIPFHSESKKSFYNHDSYFGFFTFVTSFRSHHSLISEGLSGEVPTAFSQSTPPSPPNVHRGRGAPGIPARGTGDLLTDTLGVSPSADTRAASCGFLPRRQTHMQYHRLACCRIRNGLDFFCVSTEGGSIPSFVREESVGHYHRRSITDIASKQISTPKPVELSPRSFF